MRKSLTVGLSAVALALPGVNAWAAATTTKAAPKKKIVVVRKSFTGGLGDAGRWGQVQVTIIVRKTTTTVGTKKTVQRRIIAVRVPVFPNHTDRSVFINQQALPYLTQETLQAQSASIDAISGATNTSYAFDSSLQAAILAERAW
jgi:uncharacterized protein with FMN-binding domain